jgi:4-hydroxybenzoate polyprenyltransferase
MTRLGTFLDMVRFEHTIFALPFAYLGMVLGANWPASPIAGGRLPTLGQFVWITIAMASARTLAFAVNRHADRTYDARNPRTANRPIPTGRLSPGATLGYGALALLVLVLAAWQLNDLALKLLPGAILLLVGYSYTKRFTWLSHWVLGATDALAPAGAWVAVRGSVDLPAWLLWLAVTFWIAGFDLIYACQDTGFDRAEGLYSVPARFGNALALRLAQVNHLLTVAALIAVGGVMGLGWIYWLGLAAVAGLLVYEHSLVSPTDLSRVNLAFFNINGYIAITLFVATFAALFVG